MKFSTILAIPFAIVFANAAAAPAVTAAPAPAADNPYTIYPPVPKTASINGFADRIYDQIPKCAQECVKQSTSSTPCPYWDTGCLCVIPNFTGAVGNCVASKCRGADVTNFRKLAVGACAAAGVWDPYWIIPASVSSALDAAATATGN